MTSHIKALGYLYKLIVSTFLHAHISPTYLSSELRSFVNQKYIQAQLQKRCNLDMKRESCEMGILLDMETTFSDFNIPEAPCNAV